MKSVNLYRIADLIQVDLFCTSSSKVAGASEVTIPSTGQRFTVEAIESKVAQNDERALVLFDIGINALLAIRVVAGGTMQATLLPKKKLKRENWHRLLRKDWEDLQHWIDKNAKSQWEW